MIWGAPFSLRLWRALQHPPVYHSLFRRIAQQYFRQESGSPFWLGWTRTQRIFSTTILVVLGVIGIFTVPQLLTFLIFILPITGTLLYILLHGTLVGMRQCLRIASLISRARAGGMFDLLALAPLGAFGVTWTLCTGRLYYDTPSGGSTSAQRVWISRLLFLAVVLLMTLMTAAGYRSGVTSPSATLLLSLVTVALVGFAFYLDDLLSSVIGILVGLIVPMVTGSLHITRAAAGATFLLLQTAAYLLTWIIDFVILPDLLSPYTPTFLTLLLLRLAQVGTLFALRDLLTRGLWLVFRRLMADQGSVADTRLLTEGAPGSW